MNRARLVVAAVLAAVLLGTGGFLIGRFSSPQAAAVPATSSAAAGFLRDMQVHHAQAVDMAMTIRDISTDPAVRRLAYDIALGQSQQSGQMYGLLESWNLTQASSEPAMTWMSQPVLDGSSGDHGHGATTDGTMPGMATSAQLAQLRGATGVEAEKLFLTLMIAHHRGGLAMAEGVLARTTVPQVVSMAKGIIVSQQSDIDAMQQLLAARS
ncbi:MAG TPA: DUF305 domain-containing protein [Pseudolysinimonas sp.]|nr:hypothetical protein [Schumannella sp.]HEV7742048.1 DUF305 domain-containing protein [Pseudolysinimonas sp.]